MNHFRFFRAFSATAVAVLVLAMFPAIAMAGPADHFSISGPTVVTVGAGHSYTVAALDNTEAVDTTYTGTVTIKDDMSGLPLASYDFVAGDHGVHVFTNVADGTVGLEPIKAGNGSFSSATINVDVRDVGIATQLVVTMSASAQVNVAQNVTVTAADDSGTPADTTYTGTITFASSDGSATLPAVHSMAGESGTHTFTGGVKFMTSGSQTVSVSDAGSPSLIGTSGPINVALGDQAVTITSINPVNGNVGGSYSAVATATSGLPVSWSITGDPNGICTVNSSTGAVSFTGPGLCQVNAAQGGNANWNVATGDSQSINVKNTQTIDSHSTAPVGAKVGDDYTTSAHATSGLTVNIAVDSSTSAVCSMAGAVVHMDRQGTCLVNFTQAGDTSYWAASIQQSFGVGVGDTTTTVSSVTPSDYGSSVTFTATVSGGGATPTGTVQFKDGGVDLDTAKTLSSGAATLTLSNLPAGTHTITAVYIGDANYAGSTSLGHTHVVNPVALTITASTTSITHGSAKPSITAGYAGLTNGDSKPATTPTCGVTGYTPTSPVGDYATSCSGASDPNYSITYAAGLVHVTQASSSTAVGNVPTTTTYLGSVTFTATITYAGAAPTGTVQFKDGGAILGAAQPLDGTGHATLTISTLSIGDHVITADYTGDTNYAASTGGPITQHVVGRFTPTVTVTSGGTPSVYATTVTFTATIGFGLGVTPIGTIQFWSDGTAISGAITVDGSGQAQYATPALTVGTHSITAVYSGDTNYAPETSPGYSQVVNVGVSTTTLNTSASPTAYGASVTFTATVGGAGVMPTGQVQFKDGGINIGSPVSLSGGVAQYTTASLSVATHPITAVYLADGNYAASTSNTINQVVALRVPTQIVVSAPGSAAAGTPISVTVTLEDAGGITVTTYTGTVHFTSTDGAAVLPADYSFTGADAGVHTFATEVTLKTAATQAVTVTDGANPSVHGTSNGIAVSPAPASRFVVTLGPGPVIPGASVSVTALAQDAYGNTATGYTGSVHLTTSDAAGTVAGDYAFTGGDAGSHTFATGATLNTPSTPGSAATEPTVTVTDSGNGSITGTSASIYCGYPGSTYTAIQPSRVLDTRTTDTKNGVFNMGLSGQFVVGTVRTFQVANAPYVAGGSAVAVPAGAIAVTGNLTITSQGSSGGTISLGPKVVSAASSSDPTTEPTSINFIAYENRANNVTVGLSARGTLDAVYRGAAGKRMDLVFDVTGYFLPGLTGNRLTTVSPGRVLDTRPTGQGIIHMDPMTGGVQPFRQQQVRNVKVVGAAGTGWSGPMVPPNATAVTANVTVTMATTNGYVSFGPTMVYNPKTSTTNVNKINARDVYAPDTANGITVALNGSGNLQAVWIGGAGSSANVILDITGYFTQDGAGMAYYPIIPTRMMNSGYGGSPIRGGVHIFSSSEPQNLTLGGVGQIPSDAGGISGNVTLLTPSTAGFVYVGPSPIVWASTSTVNGTVGRGVANGFDVKLSLPSNGRIGVTWCGVPQIHSNVAHVSVDVTGYFK